MKKLYIVPFLLLFFALFAYFSVYGAGIDADDINVMVNGATVVFPDQQPIMVNERTYIPVRTVSEYMGATVKWNDETQTITIYRDQKYLAMSIGNTIMAIDDRKTRQKSSKQMDVAPILVEKRVMAPIRFVVEAFEGNISWDKKTNTVKIFIEILETRGNTIGNQANFTDSTSFSYDDKYIYAPMIVNAVNPLMQDPVFLFRMDYDGSNKIKLSEYLRPNSINVYNGWVYYSAWKEDLAKTSAPGKNLLVKTKIDGSESAILLESAKKDDFKYVCVLNDSVFFTRAVMEDSHDLYKIPVEGGNAAKVFDTSAAVIRSPDSPGEQYAEAAGDVNYYCIADEWIYFNDIYRNSRALYRAKLGGQEQILISRDDALSINIVNGWVYYIANIKSKNGKLQSSREIFKVRTDGSELKPVYLGNGDIRSINVAGDWVYFVMSGDSGNILCKSGIDGSGYTELINESVLPNIAIKNPIYIVNDNIYFIGSKLIDKTKIDQLYSVQTDGANVKLIASKLM